MDVRMELSRILIRDVVDHQIIELREADAPTETEARRFPIVIGLPEAQAIDRRLKGVEILRPQTHDLLANVIERLGAKLESICINDLSDHTFFAILNVRTKDGELIEIDSRPSDAIALGIAGSVPIYVAEHVLEAATREPL
ncbi:MAG TPA: bifunctional nuclease family protein [Phycisphaerales bacterium]|nr:bifunctional nuclease family protein [Phycisphaerales bacterium]